MGPANFAVAGLSAAATRQLLHDVRNHLGNLSGLGLLLAETSRHPDTALFVQCLRNEALQIGHLLESLCALAHGIAADELDEHFDVGEHLVVLAHALQPLAQQAGVVLLPCRPSVGLSALGKPRLLNRLIGNLIRNAITHSRAHHISVSVALEHGPHTGAPQLRYLVRDDGIGLRAAGGSTPLCGARDIIGRGQGLPICMALANQLGASLRLSDGAEGGTDAELVLPLRVVASTAAAS
jgi:signal transduction histidine kinase